MRTQELIYKELRHAFVEKGFLKEIGKTRSQINEYFQQTAAWRLAEALAEAERNEQRANSAAILSACRQFFPELAEEPEEGWLRHSYRYLLSLLFPEMGCPEESDGQAAGRAVLLQTMRAVYAYEEKNLPFDPTKTMVFLTEAEVREKGYTGEYMTFLKMMRQKYVYEFMRIGIDITPFNTLGHISGVHYVAMYAGRQLSEAGVPVDLALLSGAAAGHDIGKYGCRKSEEKRIPYLHYYYTDLCYSRFGMPLIGHIAANHSTWDLELENLSAESLLLIYADFRVKSRRNAGGKEEVCFYSLDQAYDVIFGKLDNVDEAKKLRYQKVYDKLKDFENFMEARGVCTELPENFGQIPPRKLQPVLSEKVLLHGQAAVDQLKFAAIEHNIRLMSRFHEDSSFSSLIEAARSERKWKHLRTYISILEEYYTYMTEKQKLMSLKFLYEMLAHKESDIRIQAAGIMGRMVAGFSEEYKKEVPKGIILPDRLINNLTLFREYLDKIICPDHKTTAQHRKWIARTLDSFVSNVTEYCRPSCRYNYFDILESYYHTGDMSAEYVMVLLDTAMAINPELPGRKFLDTIKEFLKCNFGRFGRSEDIAVLKTAEHLFPDYSRLYEQEFQQVMDIPSYGPDFENRLSVMFLDNLKTGTPWIEKVVNISIMLRYVQENEKRSQMLHVATHLVNLIKVSETVTVRKAAGRGLLSIIDRMPMEQRNELTIELFNGLELGDYQFSKYIPDYLGILMLYLPPEELDESISELKKIMESGSEKAASSVIRTLGVMIAHYGDYSKRFFEEEAASEKRRFRLVNLLMKAYAGYNEITSQEALHTIGIELFGGTVLSLQEKTEIFRHCCKKLMTLLYEKEEGELDFYHNAAVLNHIYRYICMYQAEEGEISFPETEKVAFFPGTFDPFSLGHKAVASTIRDMGFEVYLALDEFSWSKNTQPRMQRRKLITMSIADEDDLFIFPEDIPVNIANPSDIRRLKETFAGKELYIAVGTDVIRNASCYKAPPQEDSIHTLNHIAFARESAEQRENKGERYPISGKVIRLTLEKYYEDVSSTRIRENVDMDRDISNLIDTVAQNYIYDRNMYLRELAYKHILQAKEIGIEAYLHRSIEELPEDLLSEMQERGYSLAAVEAYLCREGVRCLYVEGGVRRKRTVAFAAAHRVETADLLAEFADREIAAYVRQKAAGSIAVIGTLFTAKGKGISNIEEIVITEIMTELSARDFTYAVYHPTDSQGMNPSVIEALKRQGFVNIAQPGKPAVYAAEMRAPIVIFRDVETVIKSPLNKNPRVLRAISESHERLLALMTELYPGQLILSFNPGVVHSKIIRKVAELNQVSVKPSKNGEKGPYMSVPFGKALADVVVPNTVTKALRTEKYFTPDLKHFTIAEAKGYSALDNQAKTLRSFNRPVILIDDLLHKGYRMHILDPILSENDVEVKEIVVGVLTGNARDMAAVKNRSVEGAYFLPNMGIWLNEKDSYLFIGGDGIDGRDDASINLILPYTSPAFIGNGEERAIYDYSMTCLENAKRIFNVLEQEYQNTFEKKLTLKRLGEVISRPRIPDTGKGLRYDENLAPSVYIENDIMRLERLHR